MQPSPRNRRGLSRVGAAAGVLVLVFAGAALVAPIMVYPFGRDQGVFACVADAISRGGVPYRDAWDIKPPGIHYLFWLSFSMFGRTMLAPRLLDFIWSLATAAVLVVLGKRLLSLLAGVAGALFFLTWYALGFNYWHSTQCEGFTSLPLCLAAAALVAAEKRRSLWLAVVCGAFVSLALIIKFTVGGFLLLPVAAALSSSREPVRARLSRTAAYLTGCLAGVGVVVAMMWARGALKDMIYILCVWNVKYAPLGPEGPRAVMIPYETFHFLLWWGYASLTLIGLLALIGAADLALRPGAGRLRWLIPSWAGVMLAGIWAQGKFHPYHWLPLLPPIGLLAGQGVVATYCLLCRAAKRPATRALTAGLLLALAGIVAGDYRHHFRSPLGYAFGRMSTLQYLSEFDGYGSGDFSLVAELQVASFLQHRTGADEPIFVWGFEPLLYFLADRKPASRFITLQPLVCPWSPPEWRRELIADLERNRPPYILVVHNDIFPWWINGTEADSATQLGGYPELQRFVHTRYRLAQRIEDFDIWEKR